MLTYRPQVLALEIDKVLADTAGALMRFSTSAYGQLTFNVEDLSSPNYWERLGPTPDESLRFAREFFASKEFEKIEPMPGALEALRVLKARRFTLVIVTSRPQFIAEETRKFVDKYYPGAFDAIYFGNHYLSLQEQACFVTKSKPAICRDLNVRIFVDQAPSTITQAEGFSVISFDPTGSLRGIDGVAVSWREVLDGCRSRSPLRNAWTPLCLAEDEAEVGHEEVLEEETSDESSEDVEAEMEQSMNVEMREMDEKEQSEALTSMELSDPVTHPMFFVV
ncbi:uncharacterized protein VTP21DRAFT_7198 [Calcarisporiella thermophila]|uniref:uncharacterized protein n=1 Tax=Calcarisporiella thermophila TaxID=911321 RepID=UPI0037432065